MLLRIFQSSGLSTDSLCPISCPKPKDSSLATKNHREKQDINSWKQKCTFSLEMIQLLLFLKELAKYKFYLKD